MKTVTSRTVPGKILLCVKVNCFVVPGKMSSCLISGGSYFFASSAAGATATPLPASGLMNHCRCWSFWIQRPQIHLCASVLFSAEQIHAMPGACFGMRV